MIDEWVEYRLLAKPELVGRDVFGENVERVAHLQISFLSNPNPSRMPCQDKPPDLMTQDAGQWIRGASPQLQPPTLRRIASQSHRH